MKAMLFSGFLAREWFQYQKKILLLTDDSCGAIARVWGRSCLQGRFKTLFEFLILSDCWTRNVNIWYLFPPFFLFPVRISTNRNPASLSHLFWPSLAFLFARVQLLWFCWASSRCREVFFFRHATSIFIADSCT